MENGWLVVVMGEERKKGGNFSKRAELLTLKCGCCRLAQGSLPRLDFPKFPRLVIYGRYEVTLDSKQFIN